MRAYCPKPVHNASGPAPHWQTWQAHGYDVPCYRIAGHYTGSAQQSIQEPTDKNHQTNQNPYCNETLPFGIWGVLINPQGLQYGSFSPRYKAGMTQISGQMLRHLVQQKMLPKGLTRAGGDLPRPSRARREWLSAFLAWC